jgi:hypothetical protein
MCVDSTGWNNMKPTRTVGHVHIPRISAGLLPSAYGDGLSLIATYRTSEDT